MQIWKYEGVGKRAHLRCVFFKLHAQIGQINRILDLLIWPNSFSLLSADPKIMAICNINWTINMIFEIGTRKLHCGLPHCLSRLLWHMLFCGGSGASCICLLCNGCGFFFYSVQNVVVVVRDNGQYLIIHGEFHPGSLHILPLIIYVFESLFSAWWLFFIADGVQPKTSLFSRGNLIWVKYQVVS